MVTDRPISMHEFAETARALQSFVYLQVITERGIIVSRCNLADVKLLFQRALNTWPDVPNELLELSDNLDLL